MVSQNSYDGIDKYAADLIRHKARQLVGKAGFTEDDRPDLEQELTGGGIRVIHVSTHVALREACNRAKKARVETVTRLENIVKSK